MKEIVGVGWRCGMFDVLVWLIGMMWLIWWN